MVSYRLFAAGLVASVSALPLNINLGAYSPALVVGDGEISFGGGQDVSKLFSTLEGAAQSAAAGQTAGAATPAAAAQAAAVPEVSTANAVSTESVPQIQDTTVSTTSTPDSSLQEQAAAISTLQGMGKEIAPRQKRDLAGFDRALKFAEAALTKGPLVQLGTGAAGAGVGIIVDNRVNSGGAVGGGAAARPAAGGGVATKPAGEKRSEEESTQPRRRTTTKVTTMYVRRGVPAELQSSSKFETRDIESIPVVPVAKRDVVEDRESSTIDSINLNVNDPQGITMTFVETSEDAE